MPRTQKIFAVARPAEAVSWDDLASVMQLEAAHVWSLYERGVVREACLRTDALGAVYALESTPSEARRLMGAQPVAQQGLAGFELVPVGPFTPLALLFGTQPQPVAAAAVSSRRSRSQRVLALDTGMGRAGADELTGHLAAQARHAWALCKAGVIREAYVRTDRPGVALVLEVDDVQHAHDILAALPLVHAELIAFECLALAPFTGFDALLEGSLEDTPFRLPDPCCCQPTRGTSP